jgi:hypothetical protein
VREKAAENVAKKIHRVGIGRHGARRQNLFASRYLDGR